MNIKKYVYREVGGGIVKMTNVCTFVENGPIETILRASRYNKPS